MSENTFEYYKKEFENLIFISKYDKEEAHGTADYLLCQIALSDNLTIQEKTELVDLYKQVEKWYS